MMLDRMRADWRKNVMPSATSGNAQTRRANAYYLGLDDYSQFMREYRIGGDVELSPICGATFRGVPVYRVTTRDHYAVMYE